MAERWRLINSTSAVILIVAVVTLLNLIASVCLLRSDVYSGIQKALQFMLIWVVPLVGASVVLIVWAHDRQSESRDPVNSGEGPWLPGIGPISDTSRPTESFGDGILHDSHGGDGG